MPDLCCKAMLRLEDLKIPNIEAVNLTIEPGECMGLSGESGSGKTLLLRAIADMDEHGGQVYAEDIAQDVIDHESEFESASFTEADNILERHSRRLCDLSQVFHHLARYV